MQAVSRGKPPLPAWPKKLGKKRTLSPLVPSSSTVDSPPPGLHLAPEVGAWRDGQRALKGVGRQRLARPPRDTETGGFGVSWHIANKVRVNMPTVAG